MNCPRCNRDLSLSAIKGGACYDCGYLIKAKDIDAQREALDEMHQRTHIQSVDIAR